VIELASLSEALGKVVVFALVASVGGTAVFSFAIVGLTRYDEARREDRRVSSVLWAMLAAVCALIIVAVVVEGIIVMVRK
jgi:uncharacterized membrane protein